MAGSYGVPADAVSVALNVTAADAEAPGFLTVYPSTEPLPTASNVNYRAGGADPNLVVAKLGTDGAIKVYSDKTTDVIVDVFGYFSTTAANGFIPGHPGPRDRHPQRRQAEQGPDRDVPGRRRGRRARRRTVGGAQPDARPAVDGRLRGGVRLRHAVAATSNVNVGPGETRPNVVFAPVGADGKVSVYLDTSAHVIADVFGYYSTSSTAELFKPVKPKRIIDTRPSGVRVAAGSTLARSSSRSGGNSPLTAATGRCRTGR